MLTWGDLARERPELADAGAQLFYQFGVGLGFLATVRPNGGPRLHPVCPVLAEDSLSALLIRSPKRDDLLRDGRYAMHSFPCENNEDAFYITGVASVVEQPEARRHIVEQFVSERGTMFTVHDVADHQAFEFRLDMAMLTQTIGHGDANPRHTIWRP